MTELFKEAIIEARKLKEVAEVDARNKVIEAVTPIIKRMIAKESSTQKFLFGEDDIPMDDPMMSSEPPMEVPDTAPPTDAGLPPAGGDVSNAAPISPSGDLVGMPMPDDEGKITVDFSQLFSMGSGSQEVADAESQEMVPPPGDMAGGLPPMPTEAPPVAPVGSPEMAPAGVAGVGPEAGAAQAVDPTLGAVPGTDPGAFDGQAPVGQALTPEEEPEPIVAGESKIYNFQNEVRVVAERIDILYFRGSTPSLVKESVKSRLFTLCEQLDDLMSEGVISPKKAQIAENKLEFLFMKLNEAEERNIYKTNKGAHMTSLKEFAAKLFEEDALGPPTADKATAHAEKVSGVQPGVDLFKEGEEPVETDTMAEALLGEDAPASSAFGDGALEGDPENKNPDVHDPEALVKEPGAGIVESAPASTAFGDGEEMPGAENTEPQLHQSGNLADEAGANSILEFDEKELREAVVKLRKENLARKLKAVKENAAAGLKGSVSDKEGLSVPKPKEGDQGSAKPVGGKEPAQENLTECGMTEEVPMDMGGDSGGDAGMPGMGGEEVELTFSIDVDDLEALLNGAADQFVAEPEGEVDGGDAGGFPGSDSMDGGDSIEVVGDAGDDSPEGLLVDEPAEEPTTDESAAPASAPGKVSVKEGKNRVAAKPQVSGKAAIASLVKQLNEQKLLTAKALYVSKFTVREDLTVKQKQKIVEYFDKTSTLAEAKGTYEKIKKILSENASTTSTKLSGSGSKPTTAGSAKLNESASGNNGDQIESARWMLLAGIQSKK